MKQPRNDTEQDLPHEMVNAGFFRIEEEADVDQDTVRLKNATETPARGAEEPQFIHRSSLRQVSGT